MYGEDMEENKNKEDNIQDSNNEQEPVEIMYLNKHNTMIRAKYNLNVSELRMYLFILYNLQKEVEVYKRFDNVKINEETVLFSIPRSNFLKIVTDKQYIKMSKLESVFESLRQKPIYYEIELPNNKKDWQVFGFILKYAYTSNNDSYVFTIDRLIYDMVIKYKTFGYTPLNLALIFSLTGVYSYRLYELLRLWSNTKRVVNYRIDELKDYFMLGKKKSYDSFFNFNTKVIEPAVNELNELGLFKIVTTPKKVGRKYESIDFEIEDLDSRVYFVVPEEPTDDSQEDEDDLDDPPFDDEAAEEKDRLQDIGLEEDGRFTSFYVPNEAFFTATTFGYFKNDFGNIDFKDKTMSKLLETSIFATLERTKGSKPTTKIVVKNYNYFKVTLTNKIKDFNSGKYSSDVPKIKTRFHNIGQTFDDYDPSELERLLKESQKDKFNSSTDNKKDNEPTISDSLVKVMIDKYLEVNSPHILEDELSYNFNFDNLASSIKKKSLKEVLEMANQYKVEVELDTSSNEYVSKIK